MSRLLRRWSDPSRAPRGPTYRYRACRSGSGCGPLRRRPRTAESPSSAGRVRGGSPTMRERRAVGRPHESRMPRGGRHGEGTGSPTSPASDLCRTPEHMTPDRTRHGRLRRWASPAVDEQTVRQWFRGPLARVVTCRPTEAMVPAAYLTEDSLPQGFVLPAQITGPMPAAVADHVAAVALFGKPTEPTGRASSTV